jgi:glycosyltransferase involved in cell wall biosynthesis
MRVAIFSEVYWPMVSGVGVTLRRLADSLMRRGHAVRVYSASYNLPDSGDRPEVCRSASRPFFLYPDVQWAFPRHRALMEDVQRFRPDVIHLATEFAMGYAGSRVARQLGIPMVASAHTDYEQYASRYRVDWAIRAGWRYLRWFYSQADMVLCPTRIYEQHLHSRGVTHTGIWSRGVDAHLFHPEYRSNAYRAALGARHGDPVITYIGRLAREKNLELLLDAWTSIRSRYPSARLVLVGQGPLEEEIAGRGLAGVHLTGLLTGRDLAEAYASADLFAFPSVTETFGNVLLEAMASGLPTVVAAAGGVLEFVRHGRNSWLVEPNSADAMADGVARLLDDIPLRRGLAEGGLATARSRGWDMVDDRLLEDYARIVEHHAGRSAA